MITHHTPLIATIVAGLVVAFAMGAMAYRLRISPIAGYLLAGVLVGPFTPGFVADGKLAAELAELGVILLMFGVGLHFSLKDLLSVRKVAVPGAIAQIVVATGLGVGLGTFLGWNILASIMFGLSLSVASTVVLLRALETRKLIKTEQGRTAIGWLIVEDLVMVLTLVLLPPIVAMQSDSAGLNLTTIAQTAGIILGKVTGFILFMLVIGRRVIPWLLHWVAHTGSRELFRLAVLAIALGVAFGAALVFDVSFALGAFFAGMILGETQLSRRAAEETLPLRDAFAVLFFVSVGMLFDPAVLLENPLPLVGTVLIVILGKSIVAFGIMRGFGFPSRAGLTVAASLAQIGEFSFILAGLGVSLGVLPELAHSLILASAIISIFLNPVLFSVLMRGQNKHADSGVGPVPDPRQDGAAPSEQPQVVLVGYGRVGIRVAQAMRDQGAPLVIIEEQRDLAEAAMKSGYSVVVGSGTVQDILEEAHIARAATLLVAIPEGLESGAIVEKARAINPSLRIIARAHSDDEVRDLMRWGANDVIMAEEETARRIAEQATGTIGSAS